MSEEQLQKPIDCVDVKGEAEKISTTEGGIKAAEDKEKGVVAEASGEQVYLWIYNLVVCASVVVAVVLISVFKFSYCICISCWILIRALNL